MTRLRLLEEGRSSTVARACRNDDMYKLMSIQGAGQHAGKAYARCKLTAVLQRSTTLTQDGRSL